MGKWTAIIEYFRKVPPAFLVAVLVTLGLVLFVPDMYAQTLAVETFRRQYRIFLGPAFLLVFAFVIARMYMYLVDLHAERRALKERRKTLHNLTPEEKAYLVKFIHEQVNSVYVGMDDGVMAGLRRKGVTYLATEVGSLVEGFAFNLQPWARAYLQDNPHLLDGCSGGPLTPRQRLRSRW